MLSLRVDLVGQLRSQHPELVFELALDLDEHVL